jgi:hypothetical protein
MDHKISLFSIKFRGEGIKKKLISGKLQANVYLHRHKKVRRGLCVPVPRDSANNPFGLHPIGIVAFYSQKIVSGNILVRKHNA